MRKFIVAVHGQDTTDTVIAKKYVVTNSGDLIFMRVLQSETVPSVAYASGIWVKVEEA